MIMTGQNQLWNTFLQNIKFVNKFPVVDFETNAIFVNPSYYYYIVLALKSAILKMAASPERIDL